jgi:integrase
VVTLSGRDLYLPGRHGSAESRAAYDRAVAEWLAAGRSLPTDAASPEAMTVSELCATYWKFAQGYYKNLHSVRSALRPLRRLYGPTPAAEFGPKKLRAIQDHLVREQGCSRSYCNSLVWIIKRAFRHGVVEELVPSGVHEALLRVEGLRKGRTAAREPGVVRPVSDADLQATLPYLSEIVADMVRVQRLLGCRPGELCSLTPADLDISHEVWVYSPKTHKNAYRGAGRRIAVGPKAQAILRPYLLRAADSHCFSPADSERRRRRELRERRKTPVQPSQQDRRKRTPKRAPGNSYSTPGYRQAIERACAKAGIAPWHPNQLRHAAATEIRREFGLEAAQVVLGHSRADTTQIYAEKSDALAAAVAKQIG